MQAHRSAKDRAPLSAIDWKAGIAPYLAFLLVLNELGLTPPR